MRARSACDAALRLRPRRPTARESSAVRLSISACARSVRPTSLKLRASSSSARSSPRRRRYGFTRDGPTGLRSIQRDLYGRCRAHPSRATPCSPPHRPNDRGLKEPNVLQAAAHCACLSASARLRVPCTPALTKSSPARDCCAHLVQRSNGLPTWRGDRGRGYGSCVPRSPLSACGKRRSGQPKQQTDWGHACAGCRRAAPAAIAMRRG